MIQTTHRTDTGSWIRTPAHQQCNDATVHCLGWRLLNEAGRAVTRFEPGEVARFELAFETRQPLGPCAAGIAIYDTADEPVFVSDDLERTATPGDVPAGAEIRFSLELALTLPPGTYWFAMTLDTMASDGPRRRAIVVNPARITITEPSDGTTFPETSEPRLLDASAEVLRTHRHVWDRPEQRRFSPAGPAPHPVRQPTLMHITHTKSGSQWIYRILRDCVPERIVPPQIRNLQVFEMPILPGRVYPTAYITREQFARLSKPADCRYFVVVRDLRDTLISAYFSLKHSHPELTPRIAAARRAVQQLDTEDGLIYMMDHRMAGTARIQRSWAKAETLLVRYEDLLEHDQEILEECLIEEGGLGISRAVLQKAVRKCRFESMTGGRVRGHEARGAHERKGIAGDWRNYFTDRVTIAFKERFGDILVATGYEKDLYW